MTAESPATPELAELKEPVDPVRAAQLVEVNQQLVLATLQALTDAEAAARSAELDPLTELPNRTLLLDRFEQAITISRRRGTRMALLFVDLDKFKQVNDRHGHAVGDDVLKQVAQRLTATVRDADTVSRHGGDEFVILLSEISVASDVTRIADKVITSLNAPFVVGDQEFHLSASIGISLFPEDGEDAAKLIERADAAMYLVKRHGLGSFAFYQAATPSARGLKPSAGSLQHAYTRYELELAEREQRHAQLREANEHLLMAALSAQQLQSVAEQVQRKQKEFLAVVAHELRNPLGPIRIATGLLTRASPEEVPKMQLIIEREVEHLSRLIADLLDVSRADAGKLRLNQRTIDMQVIVDDAVEACRTSIAARRQRLVVALPAQALELHGDPVRIAQILRNLLDNASKYTPEGGSIELSVELIDTAIVITVSDDGIGIRSESLSTIFEPFVQDVTAVGYDVTGLGIGLTVVRELVQAHGGHVVATSGGTDMGSRFVVTLPQRTTAESGE